MADEKLDPRVSVAANVIGYMMFNDGRPVTMTAEGTEKISVTDEEAALGLRIAKAVIGSLADYDKRMDQATWPVRCEVMDCANPDKIGHHHHPSEGGLSKLPCRGTLCDPEVSYPGTRPGESTTEAVATNEPPCGCVG